MRKLVPRIAAALEMSPEDRMKVVREDRWIGYSAAKRILGDLERLLEHPKTPWMPNRIIVGESGNGKTALVRRFRNLHPARMNPEEDANHIPVLVLEAPPVPDEIRLFQNILDELGVRYGRTDSAGILESRLRTVLPQIGTKMIIIDEIQAVLAGPDLRRDRFMNHVKRLCNLLMIPLVLVGVPTALAVIAGDKQLARRFKAVSLPLWGYNEQFRTLLASLESFLPLREPSNLGENDDLAEEIYRLSGGTIGEASRVINEAALHAIQGGEERITKRLLMSLDLLPPDLQLIKVAESTGQRTVL